MHIKNLSFRHSKNAPYFFKDLCLELEEGRLHMLTGKNGVGKSVLLHILSRTHAGEVTGSMELPLTSLMPQQFDQMLAPHSSFLENLQFASLGRFPSLAPLKRLSHTHALLEQLHIDIKLPVHTLSGGQRQILALLMKLERGAQFLLLDEPTATLDPHNAQLVFEFLHTLQGVSLLIVCHDLDLVSRYTTGRHLHMEANSQGLRSLQTL